jgi:WD40 repeat protein
VWSGDDGAHLQTLEGHTGYVKTMAWGPDGKLYSGSSDCTIRVWSDDGATISKTTKSSIVSLVWMDGNLFAGLAKDIWVWSSDQLGPTDPPSHLLDGAVCGDHHLVGGSTGDLYATGPGGTVVKM